MASSSLPRRRNSMEIPPAIADVFRLGDEFMKLYERDQPQLQQCIEKLQNIIKTFETDFRGSTEGSRAAGVAGIIGGASLLTGIGLGVGIALAPFTLGASAVAAGVGVGAAGAATLTGAGITSKICSSNKKKQMKALRKGIEDKLKEFRFKIKPMAEKMKDIHERTEKILRDFKKLEQGANDLSKYFDSSNIQPENLAGLTVQMNESMRLLASIAEIYGGFSLVLDMISVSENSSAVADMDKLAEKPIAEEVDESKITSKAGKFIVDIRKLMNQLQDIIDGLETTKHKLSEF
ncbi:uncharacterized protein LOC107720498 [Sinocyclocheilus rhinocerous]|uniref:uncharacterized protein LOC107720498 n=1 Tax=Sinocyclocheilus rhinocerous TaxID=307959 RepID=UPI0007B887CE|nr:PREDICTED: uncharacterized protein LOC107720498 [Sinocyclocheilus rhinocerous]XP_016383711.1 PREDICTED: uncharacterized protein LOC107720498 [Sinocyclocheilus rhinocerous]XP_016383712.1 PREDICTED: uncharacterized protein LOC107720498 [Sinocyclocheilus rhinocerous]